jgi:hypothetical protein
MRAIKIEHGIPLPPPRSRGVAYPWKRMKIGDSLFVPCPNGHVARVRNQFLTNGRNHGLRLVSRSIIEKGVKGVRIWRIK